MAAWTILEHQLISRRILARFLLAKSLPMRFTHITIFYIVSHHTNVDTENEILHWFWEIEERSDKNATFSTEERAVIEQFKQYHTQTDEGCFRVNLLRKSNTHACTSWWILFPSCTVIPVAWEIAPLQGSVCWPVWSDQQILPTKSCWTCPTADMEKPASYVFYLPMCVCP